MFESNEFWQNFLIRMPFDWIMKMDLMRREAFRFESKKGLGVGI